MLPITDVGLKTALLATLIERLETGDIEPLIRLGIPAEDLEGLRRLSAADLMRFASHHQLNISYHISPTAIAQALHALKVQSTYEVELEAFIQAGASLSMLRQFFRGGREQVKLYRMMLAPYKQSGRSSLPIEGKRDDIHQVWNTLKSRYMIDSIHNLKSNSASRKALLELQMQFNDLTLEAIFAVLHEFESTPTPKVEPLNRKGNV
jgi:hypothetical protein